MFNDQTYHSVNREERFYCFLLGHALLASTTFRTQFVNLVQKKQSIDLGDKPLEVFVEVAALRDYWRDLGDPLKYSDEIDRRRRRVLDTMFRIVELNPNLIDQHSFFRTGKKLWSPAKWPEKAIRQLPEFAGKLMNIKWAFGCKPDVMIIGNSNVLIIEAKVESGEGRTSGGYTQTKTQELVSQFMRAMIPCFAGSSFTNTTLTLRGKGIQWSDLVPIVVMSDLDQFTKNCFVRFVDRSRSPAALHPPA